MKMNLILTAILLMLTLTKVPDVAVTEVSCPRYC